MKHLIKNYVQKLIKTELDAIQSKSVHDNRNFIYNGEFLILESEFGWHCFPRVQLNHALSYKNPNFDLGMRHWIVNHCKHDTTYIDIGANVGTFCGIAARHITQGKIIAIEPLTEMENSIRMNVQLNNPLVEFHHFGCAIGENEGENIFEVYEFDNRVSSLYFQKNTDIADKVKNSQVLVRKLSSLDISPTNSVVIKIDAEGAEIEILNQIYEFTEKHNGIEYYICFGFAMGHIQRSNRTFDEIFNIINSKFGSKAYFIHPLSSAEHPEFNKATQDINGNICFKYVS
ncbi:FkbM family methyltransferase [Vibrio cholerae]|nr:FkbM family methyltransferase [Vibrio cholerae]ELJ8637287.1 FkbM family methyltransferase [Vibrio cholerae]